MSNIQWTKPVCQLDGDNVFVCMTKADLDVYAKDGNYIMPGGCIDAPEPQLTENQAAKWNGKDWDLVDDYRGTTAYDISTGAEVVIDTVGAIADNLTLEPKPTEYHEWDTASKQWVLNEKKKKQAETAALEQAKADKLQTMNAAAQAFINQAAGLDAIPDFERETWVLQGQEAKAWKADKTAATPVLDGIAAARGLDANLLKEAALRKTIAYENLTATVAGKLQALRDAVASSKSVDDLDAIQINFSVEV